MTYYKIENGYPQTYSGATALDGFKEFTVDEDGVYSPSELNDAMVALKVQEEQAHFRAERNEELQYVDIMINKAEDNNEDTTALRAYRQALRDATIDWVMPTLEA